MIALQGHSDTDATMAPETNYLLETASLF